MPEGSHGKATEQPGAQAHSSRAEGKGIAHAIQVR